MKKYSFLLICLLLSFSAMAQKAVLNFEVKEHDFGKVNEEVGKITYEFEFVNKGNAPLVISRVQASCGCTTPVWTKEPIEPGKRGSITVTYSTTGRPGAFAKSITVYSNAIDEQMMLLIKGDVIPKQNADRASYYPVNLGGLMSKARFIQMNSIIKGDKQTRVLEIQNSGKVSVKPTFEGLPSYVTATVSPETLKPNEEGKITFTLNSKNATSWGPTNDEFYLILNGKRQFSEEFKLTLVSNFVEDFNRMTLDQKRKAPILDLPVRTLNFGTLKTGSKRVGKFKISNRGQNPLEIRRVINNNREIVNRQQQLTVRSGKSADIVLNLNTKNLSEGEYKKSITIQTNDPDNSFMILVLSWTVLK